MQITRHNHLRYMAKITPFLLLLYIVQVVLYRYFAPLHLRGDINLFLGIGLALIVLGFHFYDTHHKVLFHPNYLQVRFDILKMNTEILYQNIVHVEVKKKRHHYADIVLHQLDGTRTSLYHVDSPDLIRDFIHKKKAKKI